MRSGKEIIAIGTVALSVLAACKGEQKQEQAKGGGRPKDLTADAVVVKPEEFANTYSTSGSLLPYEEVSLMPEMAGRITSISFTEGGNVSAGQVLVRLNADDLKAQLVKLKAQRALQKNNEERQEALLKVGGISKQDYETTTTQIAAIDADIAYNEAQIRKTTIVAPFSGRAGIRNVSLGAVVSPTTVITNIQQVGILKMDFSLPEQYRNKVSVGKVVNFSVTGRTDTFEATIMAIEPGADATTRSVKVRARVDNGKGVLSPGAFAHVTVPFDKEQNALLIPTQAVIPTNREKVVAVVKGGKAEMVPVKLGVRTNDRVEVISGLEAGDTVLITGIMQVKPGMPVTVRSVK